MAKSSTEEPTGAGRKLESDVTGGATSKGREVPGIRQDAPRAAEQTRARPEGSVAVEQGRASPPPQSGSAPAMPLEVPEMRALLAASKDRPKEHALILLMRYSGLAMRDAATLRRAAVAGTELTLRPAKSSQLVTVDLPPAVVRAMALLRGSNPDYFWWSGRGKPVTAAKYWRGRLGRMAARAGVEGFRPHRLRDTFAVSLLGQGATIGEVSALLGHSSVQTTERYYGHWDRQRRARLRRLVQEAHSADPLLAGLDL